MANPKVKAKAGMRGHGTERWNPREWVQNAAKKTRRKEAERRAREGLTD